MTRYAFIMKTLPGKRDTVAARLSASASQIRDEALQMGLDNFSLWAVEDMLCGYGERAGEGVPGLPPSLTTAVGEDGELLTSGGRVLGVTARAATLPEAVKKAYERVGEISFENAYFRHDIGKRALDALRND